MKQLGHLIINSELTSEQIKWIKNQAKIKWQEENNTYGLVILGFNQDQIKKITLKPLTTIIRQWILLEAFVISLINNWFNESKKEKYVTDVADHPKKMIGEHLVDTAIQSQVRKLDVYSQDHKPQEAISNNQLASSPLINCY